MIVGFHFGTVREVWDWKGDEVFCLTPAHDVPAPPSARGAVGCLPPFRLLAVAAHFL